MLIVILTVILVMIAISLIGLILLQSGRGAGMVGFGGGGMEQAFGTRSATLAQKATVFLAIIFMVLTILVGLLMRKQHSIRSGQPVTPSETEGEG